MLLAIRSALLTAAVAVADFLAKQKRSRERD
jgi:hypothetical protein